MAEGIETWMCVELGKLGIDASEENARYILSIETAEDLEEYMLELIDGTNPKSRKFIKELLARWRPYNNSFVSNAQVYRKPTDEEFYFEGRENQKKKTKQSEKPVNNNLLTNGTFPSFPSGEKPTPVPGPADKPKVQQQKEVRKKQKFVSLYSQEGEAMSVIQLAGRHVCECQAAKHRLVNNCTRCGRVVCEQEGSGPCLFCGNLVCTTEEQEVLSRGSKKSEKLRERLTKDAPKDLLNGTSNVSSKDYLPHNSGKDKESLKKAQEHRDRLLDYDKTSARRTQVIDDEADYFSTDSNQWLSKKDREALRKREEELRSQRFASRKDRKVTLDFAGRRVIEAELDSTNMYNVNDDVVQQVHYGARPKVKNTAVQKQEEEEQRYLVNPRVMQAPEFVPTDSAVKRVPDSSGSNVWDGSGGKMRLQDRELQEMSDEGMCMSMHQPWASLLVTGVKKHEGRTWYSPHRGRLWIAATAKQAEPEVVADVEQTYRFLYKNPNIEFPSHYPVGCLLGCVDMTDCLAQEPYREKYPEGESGSPYVFICENPQELVVKFPIKGKHKIYKLESHIHQAAKKGLH